MLDFLFGEKVVKTTTTREKTIQTYKRMYSEEDLKYAFEQGKLHSNICYSRTFENVLEIIKIKKNKL